MNKIRTEQVVADGKFEKTQEQNLTGVNGVTGGEIIENIVGDMEVVRVINHIKKNTSRKGRWKLWQERENHIKG